jgi:hypothetical protein
MVYVPATPSGAIVQALGKMTSRDFSATRLIGGKLRALYNETERPTPAHLNELLRALDERTGHAADTSNRCPADTVAKKAGNPVPTPLSLARAEQALA